jgi:hypothetical protein
MTPMRTDPDFCPELTQEEYDAYRQDMAELAAYEEFQGMDPIPCEDVPF